MQPEVENVVELLRQRAGEFENARPNMKHEFNFQLIVGDYLIFVTSVQSSSPVRMNVGVGYSIDPRTRDWDDTDRRVESHGFTLVDGAWTDIESGQRYSEASIVDWAVRTLHEWIQSNGKL